MVFGLALSEFAGRRESGPAVSGLDEKLGSDYNAALSEKHCRIYTDAGGT
jgi:hypothetical protein